MTPAAKRKPSSKARQEAVAAATATPQRAQHDEVEHSVQTDTPGVRAQRVVAPIDRLCRTRADGSATLSEPQRQHAAAVAWREDCERGGGARLPGDELPAEVSVGGSAELVTDAQVDASRRYERGKMQMGEVGAWVAVDVVIREHTLQQVSRASGVTRDRLAGMLDAALSALADYYGY